MTDSTATLTSPTQTLPTDRDPAAAPPDPAEAFAERVFGSYIAAMEVLSIQLGADLGLYRALDSSGWRTPAELAAAVTGGGVSYSDYGSRFAHGLAELNGVAYRAELGSVWLPSIPAVDAALRQPEARVLDLGCGHGVTSVEIARAYPRSRVVGLDLDEESVQVARAAAGAAGVADRVSFRSGDAARLAGPERYDLITSFEALHDMGDPVGALRAARAVLREGGHVLVADERVAETFTAPGDEIERFCYGASVLHCLPATMAEAPVEAAGTALRPATVARWARQAGFDRLEQLPIESVFWRFYLLSAASAGEQR